jgi:hypothetical protein
MTLAVGSAVAPDVAGGVASARAASTFWATSESSTELRPAVIIKPAIAIASATRAPISPMAVMLANVKWGWLGIGSLVV